VRVKGYVSGTTLIDRLTVAKTIQGDLDDDHFNGDPKDKDSTKVWDGYRKKCCGHLAITSKGWLACTAGTSSPNHGWQSFIQGFAGRIKPDIANGASCPAVSKPFQLAPPKSPLFKPNPAA
jgi:hypothetical protein